MKILILDTYSECIAPRIHFYSLEHSEEIWTHLMNTKMMKYGLL